MADDSLTVLRPYVKKTEQVKLNVEALPSHHIPCFTIGMLANIFFFGHPIWQKYYFETHHRDVTFKSRWLAVTGPWDGKVVVDIGCGPGNVYSTVGGNPKILIGVDICASALLRAQEVGYTPLLADGHNLPLVDGFADIVIMNATLHHCDDMVRVLAEGARLVKPGGMLLTDQDPQRSAWEFKGIGLWIRQIRFPIYQLINSPWLLPKDHRLARQATEIQNRKPGDGLNRELYQQVLRPMGFDVKVYPHNHDLGEEVLTGNIGIASWRYRLSQRLSGIDPNSDRSAQSLMCIARRPDNPRPIQA